MPLTPLARDEVARSRRTAHPVRASEAHRKAESFIQNVHHFRDEGLASSAAPVEHVVVFDEAQRAWDRDQTSRFMREKRGLPEFSMSEPEFLLSVMDRHPDWAAVVGLVGGGQEINTGEAGFEAWLEAIVTSFPEWTVHIDRNLSTREYLPSFDPATLGGRLHRSPGLHLSLSLRSFRSERLAGAIAALIDGHEDEAKTEFEALLPRYPIVRTRSIEAARNWLKNMARGSERFGLLASSGARRLKPMGLNVKEKIDPCHWFLDGPEDVRSSYYLEDVATEFDVQGLELDWSAVVWDADLIREADGWICRQFSGSQWKLIRDPIRRRYRLNAYRVLLTRARQGIVIVVPPGSSEDPTRDSSYYDPTWDCLARIGIPLLAG